ncbi:hypothetical protein J3A83DRAFT_4188135 [Scleroderma citrinum]
MEVAFSSNPTNYQSLILQRSSHKRPTPMEATHVICGHDQSSPTLIASSVFYVLHTVTFAYDHTCFGDRDHFTPQKRPHLRSDQSHVVDYLWVFAVRTWQAMLLRTRGLPRTQLATTVPDVPTSEESWRDCQGNSLVHLETRHHALDSKRGLLRPDEDPAAGHQLRSSRVRYTPYQKRGIECHETGSRIIKTFADRGEDTETDENVERHKYFGDYLGGASQSSIIKDLTGSMTSRSGRVETHRKGVVIAKYMCGT